MLKYSSRTEEAGWIAGCETPPDRLITFGPAGFDAYARVIFLQDPTHSGQSEGDAGDLASGLSQLDVLACAVDTLLPFTSTPERGFFAVWDSGVTPPTAARSTSRIDIPLRESFLVEGPFAELPRWHDDLGLNAYDTPSFIWPADHVWCIAADVDPHWAGVGGSRAAIEALLADPLLETRIADPDEPQPRFD